MVEAYLHSGPPSSTPANIISAVCNILNHAHPPSGLCMHYLPESHTLLLSTTRRLRALNAHPIWGCHWSLANTAFPDLPRLCYLKSLVPLVQSTSHNYMPPPYFCKQYHGRAVNTSVRECYLLWRRSFSRKYCRLCQGFYLVLPHSHNWMRLPVFYEQRKCLGLLHSTQSTIS